MQLELKTLQHELGISFVFVTHDQEEALTMSDRIAVLDQGRIQQIGTPERALSTARRNEFVARFIGESNLFDGAGRGHRRRRGAASRSTAAASARAARQPGLAVGQR